jgi:precorrin-2 dehydrogenase/sirohydrochlorin ferrochelatase
MKYYPVYLDLRKRPSVVIGGGRVAERKILSLLEAGAAVTVVSPLLTPKLAELAAAGKIVHREKKFEDTDITGAYLVVAATDSEEINRTVGRICRNRQVLVNVAAPPEESTFIVPSLVDRGELLIAISTCGASPALSRKIRQELEERYGPEYDLFLEKMAMLRRRLAGEVRDVAARRSFFKALVDSDVLELLRQGRQREADRRIAELTGVNMQ